MPDRIRKLISLGAALALAAIISAYVYHALTHPHAAKQSSPVHEIVIASEALPFGTRLEANELRKIDWPSAQPLAGSFSNPEDCVGRALLVPVVENEPILEANLARREAGAGLPAVIPDGMRAISVAVNDVIAVSGFIQPGSLVDVLATGSSAGQGASNMTRTVLQGVRVVAAGQKIQADEKGQPQTIAVITLLVSPDEANILTLASTEAHIQLSLRNTLDAKHVSTVPAEQNWLFTGVSAPVREPGTVHFSAPAAPLRLHGIEVIRGNKREMENVPNP
jgi:pilus assembly protein CpaB